LVKKTLSEVDAMRAVDDALVGLEAEARNRVMAWASSKYHTEAPKPSRGGSGGAGNGSDDASPPAPGSLGHIKDFIVKKQPATLYERVACLAYHLEKVSDLKSFKASDIAQANTDARASKIDNVAVVVNDATTKYGFLAAVGHGAKALAARGEAVVEALPDRDKVKEVLAKRKSGRSRGRRKKK
jgi:hypothetical protein